MRRGGRVKPLGTDNNFRPKKRDMRRGRRGKKRRRNEGARKREGVKRIFSSPVRMHANAGEEMKRGEGVEEEKKRRRKGRRGYPPPPYVRTCVRRGGRCMPLATEIFSITRVGIDYRHPVPSYTKTVIPLPISSTQYRHRVLDIIYPMTSTKFRYRVMVSYNVPDYT